MMLKSFKNSNRDRKEEWRERESGRKRTKSGCEKTQEGLCGIDSFWIDC